MSAIFGQVELTGRRLAPEPFHAAFAKLARFGPDRSDVLVTDHAAVGRHLLSIAPASAQEHAPTADGSIVVADAILDNRGELAQRLGLALHEASLLSDTALIQRAYEKWGVDCPSYLVGDFAFAFVSGDGNEVFLACDHIGARPLFYSIQNDALIFSTSIEAMLEYPWRWAIDERVVAEYLHYPLFPASKPFFTGIEAVAPGCSVLVREGRVKQQTWWRPSAKSRGVQTDSNAAETCLHLLEQAIDDRIATNARIGAHLSGGIDSTGVAVIAQRMLRANGRSLARGYSWSPAVSPDHPVEARRDERAIIASSAAKEMIPLYFGDADAENFLSFIDRPIEVEGETDVADEVPVLRAAHADGVRVLLSGWGGDEAFSAHGAGYVATEVFAGKPRQAARFARASGVSLSDPKAVMGLIWRELVTPLLPDALYRQTAGSMRHFPHACYISHTLRARHADLARTRPPPFRFGYDVNRNLKLSTLAGHLTMRMRSWAAWSSAFAIQYRYPLTDRRLLEFVFALSPEALFLKDKPRGLARAVLADCLPAQASKRDVANEKLRKSARETAWRAIAARAAAGGFAAECPWLDMDNLRARAMNPIAQDGKDAVLAFAEMFSALRIWALYQRALARSWV